MSHREGFNREPDLQPPLDYVREERDECALDKDRRQREDDEQTTLIEQQSNVIVALQATLTQKRLRVERLGRNLEALQIAIGAAIKLGVTDPIAQLLTAALRNQEVE